MSTLMIMLITAGVLLLVLGVSFRERIARIFKAKANTLADSMEDPTEMANQIVRELNESLQRAIDGEAQIKTIVISNRAKQVAAEKRADEWKAKTNQLLDRIKSGALEAAKGNELAGEAAKTYQAAMDEAARFKTIADNADQKEKVMAKQVVDIRNRINDAKTKTIEIDARAKAAEAMELVNKTLSSVDTNGLMNTLDRMEEKVMNKENKAQAYSEIDSSTRSTQDEINAALGKSTPEDALAAFIANNRPA